MNNHLFRRVWEVDAPTEERQITTRKLHGGYMKWLPIKYYNMYNIPKVTPKQSTQPTQPVN